MRRSLAKKYIAFSLLSASALILLPATSSVASDPYETSCAKVGSQKLENRDLYTCSKVGTLQKWKFTDDGTALFMPFQISGPTWNEIAEQREAEIKAAELLRIQREAESKAAKAAAEIPKIAGLTIGKLLWSDDFIGNKGSSINSKNWSARNCHRTPGSFGGGACFDAEVVYYAPSAIALDGSADGAAVISTNRITGALPADAGMCLSGSCFFTSGRFDTHGKVAFQYGFIEARIKMPAGSGNHPAFWMLGDNINQVGWPLSGEMDITEIRGNDPRTATSATHFSTVYSANTCCNNHRYLVNELDVGADVTVDFHTYAVAWLPNSISYYVDGKLISTTTPAQVGGHWSFNDKFFLIVNNAVNASFSGSWQNLFSSQMTIDWVRSYQLNGVGEVFTK
jgi:beta-glucanase (GH16 family)